MKFKGVIFDMDGILFDTERLYQDSWYEMAAERNINLGEDFAQDVCGSSGDYMLKILSKYYHTEDTVPLVEECIARMRKKAEIHLPVKKGVKEILEYFREQGLVMCVASSSLKEQIQFNLEKSGLSSYFTALTSGSEVEKGKPCPDIFLLAAEKIGCKPEECLVFEDSFNGVRAGCAAGCYTIMIPDLIAPDEEMQRISSDICSDFLEVLAWLKKENA